MGEGAGVRALFFLTRSFVFSGLRFAGRAIWLPQIQEADMPSFGAADALFNGIAADGAFFKLFHIKNISDIFPLFNAAFARIRQIK